MMLGCAGFIACGGGETETAPPTEEDVTPPSDEGEPTEPSPSGAFWNDMPVYPGASRIQEMTWTVPPAEGEWAKLEWRYYETRDTVSEVAAFYKSHMPANGWGEMGWMEWMETEMEEMQWGYYTKNNEQDVAWVWIGAEEGKTFIALMRGSE